MLPPAWVNSSSLGQGRLGRGRLVNVGSGVGQAEGERVATGVALWGPGGCCLPYGVAEPGGSQGCQGVRVGLEERSGCWRAEGVAWWAGLVQGAWLWRKKNGEFKHQKPVVHPSGAPHQDLCINCLFCSRPLSQPATHQVSVSSLTP